MRLTAEGTDKAPEIGIELGRPSCQIDKFAVSNSGSLQNEFHGRPFHDLFPKWRCFEMTVVARLIASETEIDLEGLNGLASQSIGSHLCDFLFEFVHKHFSFPP
jgi:hypothetical protein